MKKIFTLAAGVLFSTLVFADGTKEATGSKVAVMNSGSDLIKVFYKAPKSNTVTVSILNEKNEKLFTERMKGDNFMRPYNFKGLPAGHYTIKISDGDESFTEKVDYGTFDQANKANIVTLSSETKRYLVSGTTASSENITVKIYDAEGKSIFQDDMNVDGNFAKVYNLSAIKSAFTIQVSDKDGALKDFDPSK